MMWLFIAIICLCAVAFWHRGSGEEDKLTDVELDKLATPISKSKSLTDSYFSKFEEINTFEKERNYEKALECAWDALKNFSAVADDLGCPFRSPPFDYVCTHAVLSRDQRILDRMGSLLERGGSKHLAPFKDQLEEYQYLLSLFTRVCEQIHQNPGVLQRSLGKLLSEDGRTISTWIKRAENRHIIRREVSGKTFALYMRDK